VSVGAHISAALRVCDSLGELCQEYAWGSVAGDTRFPDVHDANRALVVGVLTPPLSDVMAAVSAMRTRTGVSFEQVEVVDIVAHATLHEEMTAEFGRGQRFVVMRAEQAPSLDDRYASFSVEESPAPDEDFWLEIKRAALHGVTIPEAVVRQLTQRDLIVHFHHGRRLFVARSDGSVAAVAAMHTFGSAALVDDVATLPQQRRRGAATAAVRGLMEEAQNRQASELFLFAAEHGDAQRIYERLGFRVIAVSAQFHRDRS
jgi:ribosomal protein S18 acetylase RimI-like enzyme